MDKVTKLLGFQFFPVSSRSLGTSSVFTRTPSHCSGGKEQTRLTAQEACRTGPVLPGAGFGVGLKRLTQGGAWVSIPESPGCQQLGCT